MLTILYENDEWFLPLAEALRGHGVDVGGVDLNARPGPDLASPPSGIWWNKMSASAHQRGNRDAAGAAGRWVDWLEVEGARLINGSKALSLELSKIRQYEVLRESRILTPETIAIADDGGLRAQLTAIGFAPLMIKPNCGGKGAGVMRFSSGEEAAAYLSSIPATERPGDGIWVAQAYVEVEEPFITRCEFVGGKLLYAIRVDAADGFELCPADACDIDLGGGRVAARFRILSDFDDPLIADYEAFLAANDIQIGGIEFLRDKAGRAWTYDINVNTNYNSAAEARAGRPGWGYGALAAYFISLD